MKKNKKIKKSLELFKDFSNKFDYDLTYENIVKIKIGKDVINISEEDWKVLIETDRMNLIVLNNKPMFLTDIEYKKIKKEYDSTYRDL